MQTFDPHKHYGANSARFFNYINLCLGNKFRTIYSKRMKNPLCRPGNLSLSTHLDETDRDQVGDEFCHAHSAHLRKRCERQERQREDRHLIGEFVDFVQREDSGVVPVMRAITATETLAAGAELLGTTEADFCRKRSRLRQLGRCFIKNELVPKRRKAYRRRLKRTAPSTPLGFTGELDQRQGRATPSVGVAGVFLGDFPYRFLPFFLSRRCQIGRNGSTKRLKLRKTLQLADTIGGGKRIQ